jgi:hypothetical protein
MPAESKASDQVKKPASSAFIQQHNLALQKCPGRKPAKSPDLCRYSFRFVFIRNEYPHTGSQETRKEP